MAGTGSLVCPAQSGSRAAGGGQQRVGLLHEEPAARDCGGAHAERCFEGFGGREGGRS